MLLVAESGRGQEVLKVFEKWGLDGVIVGRVTSGGSCACWNTGKLVANIPNTALTDDAPLYHRPMSVERAGVANETGEGSLERATDLTDNLKTLAARAKYLFQALDL